MKPMLKNQLQLEVERLRLQNEKIVEDSRSNRIRREEAESRNDHLVAKNYDLGVENARLAAKLEVMEPIVETFLTGKVQELKPKKLDRFVNETWSPKEGSECRCGHSHT